MKRFNADKEFNKSNRKYTKKHLVFSLFGLIALTVLGISFAYFQINDNSVVINSVVDAPINLKIMAGGVEVDDFPEASSDLEYDKTVCTNGSSATWDDSTRDLSISFNGNDDCTAYFIVMTPLQRCLNDYENRGLVATADEHFTYTTNRGNVTITDYSETAPREVVVPCEINDNPVVTLGSESFSIQGNPSIALTSAVLPLTLNSIEREVFYGNSLSYLSLPNSLTTIGSNAFFRGLVVDELVIPDSVQSIAGGAFQECNINSLILGDDLVGLGAVAFSDSQITSVVFGTSTVLFNDYSYGYSNSPFSGNSIGNIIIPEGWTKISEGMFDEANVSGVTFPSTLTEIEAFAFENHRIKSLEIPSSVHTIDDSAFDNGSSISNLVLHEGLKILGNVSLGSVSDPEVFIPSSVTNFENAIGASNGIVINFLGKSGPEDFILYNGEWLASAVVNFIE